MKALLAVLLVAIAPAHLRFAILGIPVSIPAAWLVVRAIRRFRSVPWLRPSGATS
jgi:hypothetical protein